MAFDRIKEDIREFKLNVYSYIHHSTSYYKIKAFKLMVLSITSMTQLLVVGSMLTIALIFLSFAASIGLGQLLDNLFLGYLIVGGFYLAVAGLLYLNRSQFERSIIKKFSESFFDETDDEEFLP